MIGDPIAIPHADMTEVLVATEDLIRTVHDLMNCGMDSLQNMPQFVSKHLKDHYSYEAKINGFHFKEDEIRMIRTQSQALPKAELDKLDSTEYPQE